MHIKRKLIKRSEFYLKNAYFGRALQPNHKYIITDLLDKNIARHKSQLKNDVGYFELSSQNGVNFPRTVAPSISYS